MVKAATTPVDFRVHPRRLLRTPRVLKNVAETTVIELENTRKFSWSSIIPRQKTLLVPLLLPKVPPYITLAPFNNTRGADYRL